MAKQVTLNLKSLQSAVSELEKIKGEISKHAGTQAEKLKKARAEALPTVKVPVLQIKASDTIDAAEAAVAEWQSTLSQRIDEATTKVMRASKDNTDKGLTALRASFAEKRDAAVALQSVLGPIVAGASELVIPSLKGTGKIGTGTSKANTKGQQFYRLVDGVRKDQPVSQNKFSSMAFYFGRAIGVPEAECTSNEGKGCGASALETFLKGKGISDVNSKDWTYKVSDTLTVGLEITAAPAE